jgi:hypothetical protein
MRVFRPLSKHEREVSDRKERIQARLRSMSDVDRLVASQKAMHSFQQIRAGKTQSPIEGMREYNRNRTLERVVHRTERGAQVPHVQLGGKSPRRSFGSPAGYPNRTALHTVLAYSGKSRK